MSSRKKVVAVFDFDGTLTFRDTFRDFFIWQFGGWRFYLAMLLIAPVIALYVLGLVGNDASKQILIRRFLRGSSEQDYLKMCTRYGTERIPSLIRSDALEKVKWHLVRGHEVIIISASLADWIIPWAKSNGIQHVLATKVRMNDGYVVGVFDGPCIYGPEKVLALQRAGVDRKTHEIYAYGDSQGDLELLSMAHHSAYRSFKEKKVW